MQGAYWQALGSLIRSTQPADALYAARQSREIFLRENDDLQAAYATWLLTDSLMRVDGAIGTANEDDLLQAIDAAGRHGDRHLGVGLFRNLARLHSDAGHHDQARKALHDAANLLDRTDSGMLASLLGSSALEEFLCGQVETAMGLWRQAASLAEAERPAFAALEVAPR